MPDEHWNIRPSTGFGVESGYLNAVGYHGPNTLGASSPLQDMEFSLWTRYRDLRLLSEIPTGEQQFDIELRRGTNATGNFQRVWLRLEPHRMRLMSTNGISTSTVATATVNSSPGAWYNLRIRIVGSQVRVWRRSDAGTWGSPVLSVATLPDPACASLFL